MVKRPYPPGGPKKRGGRRSFSEYAKELREKQRLKSWYHLGEKQFKDYIKKVLKKRGRVTDSQDLLIKYLERRLDNVIFRLGFSPSRLGARQLVTHGHFLVSGQRVNIPSYSLGKGDRISALLSSRSKPIFQKALEDLAKRPLPAWLKFDSKTAEVQVIGEPSFEEAAPPADISAVFEFYSR